MERTVAVQAHTIPDRLPLRLSVRDLVEVGRRDSVWPAFVFVQAAAGSGWVPARHLSAGTGTAEVLVGYDTTELPTQVGDVLEILERDDESGWHWCRAADGACGWVPARTLEPE